VVVQTSQVLVLAAVAAPVASKAVALLAKAVVQAASLPLEMAEI
jgi:hypothetical protein